MLSNLLFGQDFTNVGKAKWVKVSGGVSANSVFYEGVSNRDPFTYFLNGNININIKGVYNMPLSFSYSNQEFDTNRPFSFNRLSINPSYKWIATHIGDVSVSFSPYTLNGHQFTGLGIDLTPPDKPFKISTMYGRLLKESEFIADDENSIPAFKRIGLGFKFSYQFKNFDANLITFKAKDDVNSLQNQIPIALGITPKDNAVASLEINTTLLKKANVHIEYASSLITEDLNTQGSSVSSSPLAFLVDDNITSTSYNAYNLNLDYPVAKGSLGVGYERIDPNYRTLGAYFFNNDLENITANASQSIFNSKVNISVNIGLQKDDLENKKSSQLQRVVSSYNADYSPNEKLNISAGYSNFRSFTNIKNQFDEINQINPIDNIDTLDFQQLSQNANLNFSYQLKRTKIVSKNFNLSLSAQVSANEQNGQATEGGESNFYNASSGYNLSYPKKTLGVNSSLNVSFNTFGEEESITIGPSVAVNKQFFEKKLRTNFTTSYNQNRNNGEKISEVINLRINGGYVYKKKHNFSLSLLSQFRNSETIESTSDFTATFSYNYSFNSLKLKKNKTVNKNKRDTSSEIRIVYRDSVFEGSKKQIIQQLTNLQYHKKFKNIPLNKKQELSILRKIVEEEKQDPIFKEKTITFLKELFSYEDFTKAYKPIIGMSFKNILIQMGDLDIQFEKEYVKAELDHNSHRLYNKKVSEIEIGDESNYRAYLKLKRVAASQKEKLQTHRWMQKLFIAYVNNTATSSEQKLLEEFQQKEKNKIFRIKNNSKNEEQVEKYIFQQILIFYSKKAKTQLKDNQVELKYINKN